MTSRNLAKKVAGFAFSKKAFDVRLLDLRKVTDIAESLLVHPALAEALADASE